MHRILLILSILCFYTPFFGMTKAKSMPQEVPAKPVMTCPVEPVCCPFVLPCPFEEAYSLLEMKAGYFFFASSEMRDVYSSGGFALELSGSCPIYNWLQIYGSMGYLQASGTSQGGDQSTTIWQLPIDLGLKPVFNIASFIQYYIAIGPRYFYVHQHNDSFFVDQNLGKSGIGFFANTGFNFFPTRHLFIDIFAEYAYEPVSFSSSKTNVFGSRIQVSPVVFGAGIGYAF